MQVDVNECHFFLFLSDLSKELESRTHILAKLHSRTLHVDHVTPRFFAWDAHGQLGQEILGFSLARDTVFEVLRGLRIESYQIAARKSTSSNGDHETR
jgi:hypothetical protein